MYIYIEGNRERKKIAGGERDREWTSYTLRRHEDKQKNTGERGREKKGLLLRATAAAAV